MPHPAQYQRADVPTPEGVSSAFPAALTPGALLAALGDCRAGCHPVRRVWWMKHLSLLTVLQAACLAIGLAVHAEGLAGRTGAGSMPFLLMFSWISLVQGGLGYVIFSRLYHVFLNRQEELAAELRSQQSALSRTRDAVVLGLTRMAESRDDDTEGHLERVGMLAQMLAEAAGARPEFRDAITPQFTRLIRFSATLHDIGKVGIEDAILQKPGSLTADERKRMQRHTRISSSFLHEIETCLGDANFLQMAHEVALFHHERWDGAGYPTGLSGERIPLAARIVAIVDVYDALAAKRPYKEAYEHDRCVAIIRAGKGSQFDPRLIDVFLQIKDQFRGLVTPTGIHTSNRIESARFETGSRTASAEVSAGNSTHSMTDRELERILANVNVSLVPGSQGQQAAQRS